METLLTAYSTQAREYKQATHMMSINAKIAQSKKDVEAAKSVVAAAIEALRVAEGNLDSALKGRKGVGAALLRAEQDNKIAQAMARSGKKAAVVNAAVKLKGVDSAKKAVIAADAKIADAKTKLAKARSQVKFAKEQLAVEERFLDNYKEQFKQQMAEGKHEAKLKKIHESVAENTARIYREKAELDATIATIHQTEYIVVGSSNEEASVEYMAQKLAKFNFRA